MTNGLGVLSLETVNAYEHHIKAKLKYVKIMLIQHSQSQVPFVLIETGN